MQIRFWKIRFQYYQSSKWEFFSFEPLYGINAWRFCLYIDTEGNES